MNGNEILAMIIAIIGGGAVWVFIVLGAMHDFREEQANRKFIDDCRDHIREKYGREPTEEEDLWIRMHVYYD